VPAYNCLQRAKARLDNSPARGSFAADPNLQRISAYGDASMSPCRDDEQAHFLRAERTSQHCGEVFPDSLFRSHAGRLNRRPGAAKSGQFERTREDAKSENYSIPFIQRPYIAFLL